MTPLQVQLSVQVMFRANWLPILTVGEPGDQGAEVTGTQGTGVSVPPAAAVAAATWGLLGVLHMPNGNIFVMGM